MPLRYSLSDLDLFVAKDGRALSDADLPECSASQLPGVCGFSTLIDAGRTCIQREDCKRVNVFCSGKQRHRGSLLGAGPPG